MEKLKTTEGELVLRDARIAIVASRFNEFIVDSLIRSAHGCLLRHGASESDLELLRAPGACELPLVVEKVAQTRRADGIVVVGAVIRGATPHFDFVAGECIRGVMAASRSHGIPVGVGVLTVDTLQQAIERAGTKGGNKGEEAALAVIEMINLLRRLD